MLYFRGAPCHFTPNKKKWKKTLDTCRYVDPVCLRCRVWGEDMECKRKGKEIPQQAWRDPERFRRLKLPDF